MKIQAKQLYLIFLALIAVALIAVGASTYMALGILQKKAGAVSQAKLETQVLEEKQKMLRKAKSDIAKYNELADVARSIVPQDKDQAQAVREIANLAAENNITLGSITFPASTLGDKKGSQSQIKAVKNIPGVYVLAITIRSETSAPTRYSDVINFLKALEGNRRTALVTGVTLTPDKDNSNYVSFVLTVDEYIKP